MSGIDAAILKQLIDWRNAQQFAGVETPGGAMRRAVMEAPKTGIGNYSWLGQSNDAGAAAGPGEFAAPSARGGDWYDVFDGNTGQYLRSYRNTSDAGKMLALALAIGGAGYAAFGGGAGAAGAAGAGTGGGTGTLGAAAFNPAMDSQLANAGIAAAGGDPLAGYLAAGATPGAVSVDGALLGAGAGAGGAAGALGAAGMAGTGALGAAGAAASSIPTWAKVGAGLLGAVAGSKPVQQRESSTTQLDPAMRSMLYGNNGLLPAVNQTFAQQVAQGGLNDVQRQGLLSQYNVLNSPQYAQGYQNMAGLAQGLLGRSVAGNPFMGGK